MIIGIAHASITSPPSEPDSPPVSGDLSGALGFESAFDLESAVLTEDVDGRAFTGALAIVELRTFAALLDIYGRTMRRLRANRHPYGSGPQ